MSKSHTRVLLSATVLTIILAAVVTYFHLNAYHKDEQQVQEEFQNEQLILSEVATSSISHVFRFISRQLQQFAVDPRLTSDDPAKIQFALKKLYQVLSPRAKSVSRMDRRGNLIGVYPFQKNVIGQNVSRQPHVQAILTFHTPLISNPIQAVQGFKAIIVHWPIFRKERAKNKFDGSVAALVPLEFLSRVLDSYSDSTQVYRILLTDEKGTILTAADKGLIGQNLNRAAGFSFPGLPENFTANSPSWQALKQSQLFEDSIVTHRDLSILHKKWHVFLLTPRAHLQALTHRIYFSKLWLWLSSLFFFLLLWGTILFGLYRWNHQLNKELANQTREISESEKRFKLLFTESIEGIYQSTPEGKFIQVNPALAAILGYDSVDDLINVPVPNLFLHPGERKAFQKKLEENGFINNFENHLRKKDGTEIIVLENARVMHNLDGSYYYQGSILDITRRKQFEERLNSNYVFSQRLLNYSEKISRILETEAILEAAVQSATQYFSFPMAWFGTIEKRKSIAIQKVSGGTPLLFEILQKECLESFLCPHIQKVLDAQKMATVSDLQDNKMCRSFSEEALKLGYRSVLYLPLVVEENIFGIIAIYERRPNAFSKMEMAHLQTFANLTSIALEKSIFLKNVKDSERKYSVVVENALNGIFLLQDGIFQFVNQRLAGILGYSVDELVGESFELVVSPQMVPLVTRRYKMRLKGLPTPSVYKIMVIRKDGSEVPVELSISLISHENKPTILGIVHDLSEQQKAKKALYESESRYRRLFENAPVGITQFFSDGSLLTANATWFKMLQYSNPDELIHVNLKSIFQDSSRYDEMMRQLEEKGILTDFESRMKCRDGSVIVVQSTIRAEKNADGRIRFYEGVHQDISHRKMLEQELLHAQKMESIGTLTGGIAHDFNNILTGILGNANFILEDVDPTHPSFEDAKQIVALGERAVKLIRQLLTFSRSESIERIPIDLNTLLKEALNLFQRTFPETIHFRMRLEKNHATILADPEQIHQILLNLSINARDAMPNGGTIAFEIQKITITEPYQTFHTQAQPGEYIQLSVSDTGMGIPERILDKIFDPFFTTKKVGKGTGLGLSMVYGIVKNHHGFIQVDSQKDKGTTFRIYFPAIPDEATERPAEQETKSNSGIGRILLVEDEKQVRTIARRILEGSGYSVVEAFDGQNALQIFETDAAGFDLIISDVVMPRLGGIQLMEAVLSKQPTQRFFFISGYSGGKLQITGYSGPVEMVNKPFHPDELLEMVQKILNPLGAPTQSLKTSDQWAAS